MRTFLGATHGVQEVGDANPTAFITTEMERHRSASTYETFQHYHVRTSLATGGVVHGSFLAGFLSYNSVDLNPTTQPDPPPRLIKFSIDGVSHPLAGTESTAIVPIVTGMRAEEVAKTIHDTINTSFVYAMLFTALPQNGDYVAIYNDTTPYTILWWDTAFVIPPNPTAFRIIRVEFTTNDTIEVVRNITLKAIHDNQIGIPLPQDWGSGLPIYDESNYYIHA